MEHRKILPSHSKIASVVSSRLLPWRDGLTATKRRVPSLLLLVGFGLIVVAAALVVRDTVVDAEDDLKHRVATHAFARNSGGVEELRDGHLQVPTLQVGPSPRIYGGEEAKLGEFPWHVLVEVYFITNEGELVEQCGGSIMSARWVLSAAHCFDQKESVRAIVAAAGMIDRRNPSHVSYAFEVFLHHFYGGAGTLKYDVALLKVEDPFPFNEFIKPVELPTQPEDVITGEVTYSGFGDTRLGVWGIEDNRLRKVTQRILPTSICKEMYKSYTTTVDDTTMFCTSNENLNGFCDGDSGGAAVQYSGRIAYQKGIISFVRKCADPAWPSVFAIVPPRREWIEKTMEEVDADAASAQPKTPLHGQYRRPEIIRYRATLRDPYS